MNFKLWSIWHFLYIALPFICFVIIYFVLRNKSEKTKRIFGYVIGSISILILVVRNIDIYLRNGWDLEVVPLQVCHIGSLIAGFALIFRKKWLCLTLFGFNLIPAILATIFAEGLTNYDTLLKIRPQTYIWGHLFIIVCALYVLFFIKHKYNKKDLMYAMIFVGSSSIVAIICNSLFRHLFNWQPNYFYLFDDKGTPLKFLYNAFPKSTYGWFEINWFYTVVLILVFVGVFIGMYFLLKLFTKLIDKTKEKEVVKK